MSWRQSNIESNVPTDEENSQENAYVPEWGRYSDQSLNGDQ